MTKDATTRLTGYEAIDFAAAHTLTLSKYQDPTEGPREGLDPEEAREIAAEDPSLIYLEVVRLDALTALIEGHERHIAPGSESALWDEYCGRIEDLTGVLPYDEDNTPDLVVPVGEAGWWLGAYERAYHLTLEWEGEGERPKTIDDTSLMGVGDAIGIRTDDFFTDVRSGYSDYVHERETDGADF